MGGTARTRRYCILKFGGTSVTGAERVDLIARITSERARTARPVLVVSAFAGVTDALRRAAAGAARGAWRRHVDEVAARHEALAAELVGAGADRALPGVAVLVEELDRVLHGIELLADTSPRALDRVQSFGERLAAHVIAAALAERGLPAAACDARRLIVTSDDFGDAAVQWDATEAAVRPHFATALGLQVVTGFIGATATGDTTTLGRSGSDYTAAILGAALDAELVEIWTDVPGVMSADPRVVPDARPLRTLGYDELLELSHWGARVVHPATARPLRERGVPLRIRSALDPADPGTLVDCGDAAAAGGGVRGIASLGGIALLHLRGGGVPLRAATASRLFAAVERARTAPLLACQASRDRSLCVALDRAALAPVLRAVEDEFRAEIGTGMLDARPGDDDAAIVTVVGDEAHGGPGVAGTLFSVLGEHGVGVQAIGHGTVARSISVVVAAADERRAVRALHDALLVRRSAPVELFLAGPGRVGSALLSQLAASPGAAARVRLAGVARRSAVALTGIPLDGWQQALLPSRSGLHQLVEAAIRSTHQPRVFVDCTAGPEAVEHYEALLRAGVAVVTANKVGFAGEGSRVRRLAAAGAGSARCYHETTVGAGLPVLRTLEDMVATGDRIHRVDGALSGTIGYILDEVSRGVRFSEAVRDAHTRGYTEPDPREDLGGGDVARKLLILGRAAGYDLEPADIVVEPLVPDWSGLGIGEFWERLGTLDDEIEARRAANEAAGLRLAYVGSVGPGGGAVRLEAIEPGHPCWSLSGTENLVAIVSDRYTTLPLVIRGPGAGTEVTAAGVFADVLRAAAEAGRAPPRPASADTARGGAGGQGRTPAAGEGGGRRVQRAVLR